MPPGLFSKTSKKITGRWAANCAANRLEKRPSNSLYTWYVYEAEEVLNGRTPTSRFVASKNIAAPHQKRSASAAHDVFLSCPGKSPKAFSSRPLAGRPDGRR